ncbi:MAG TPA: BON domain-containing protein [Gaiellaceae bacterium]|jgi:osmotically-inducible protein OsmY|nr:BON domain-containing protein [Gaiellaceae bacterium]
MRRTPKSDTALREAVLSELDWDPEVDARHIGVSANEGAITLDGYVASYSQKVAALHAAERVYGVKAIADGIEVEDLPPGKMTDSEIAEEIAQRLTWNESIPESVEAEVVKGHVTLRGEVEWGYQRAAAERVVRDLWAVRRVKNEIAVVPRVEPNPAEIERRVGDAIERLADLDERSIRVTARDGTVHLEGHVHSLAERRLAERAAESAPGVRAVQNDLVVES